LRHRSSRGARHAHHHPLARTLATTCNNSPFGNGTKVQQPKTTTKQSLSSTENYVKHDVFFFSLLQHFPNASGGRFRKTD
jgi:hypothetical protein